MANQDPEIIKAIAEAGEQNVTRLLDETAKAVYGPRQKDYGTAKENHENIAALWSVILGIPVSYQQVIQCMIAVKLARLCNSPDHRDSWIDVAGYAAVWDKAQRGE